MRQTSNVAEFPIGGVRAARRRHPAGRDAVDNTVDKLTDKQVMNQVGAYLRRDTAEEDVKAVLSRGAEYCRGVLKSIRREQNDD